MKIILHIQAANKTSTVSVNGVVVTVNSIDYDLSQIPEGGQAEAVEGTPFVGVLTRDKVNILYQYDSSKALPDQTQTWDDLTFDITEGEIICPIQWKPVVEETNVLP